MPQWHPQKRQGGPSFSACASAARPLSLHLTGDLGHREMALGTVIADTRVLSVLEGLLPRPHTRGLPQQDYTGRTTTFLDLKVMKTHLFFLFVLNILIQCLPPEALSSERS